MSDGSFDCFSTVVCFVSLSGGTSNRCSALGWLRLGPAEGRDGLYRAWVRPRSRNVREDLGIRYFGDNRVSVLAYIVIVVSPVYEGIRVFGVGINDSVER